MDFAYTIKNQDLDFFSTLSSFLPEVTEDGIKVTVHNSTQQGDLFKIKQDLLGAVRKTLQNFDVDFEVVLNKSEAKKIAVTPQEKYAEMVKKNPLLEELRKKMDLGF